MREHMLMRDARLRSRRGGVLGLGLGLGLGIGLGLACGVGVEGGEQLVTARARVAAEEAVEQPVPLPTPPRARLLPLLTTPRVTPRGGWRRCGVCGAVLLLGDGLGLG